MKRNLGKPPHVIHSYTRANAIEDEALVDVSLAARDVGFKCLVAITRAAWDYCVALGDAAQRAGCDEAGRLHDVLWMLRCAIRGSQRHDQELTFQLLCVTDKVQPSLATLRAVAGPGDDGELVMTIMLPTES